jgi:Xaa-Pro aminopeptidase
MAAVTNAKRDVHAKRSKLDEVLRERDLAALVLTSYEAVSVFAGTNIITQFAVPDRFEFAIVTRDGGAIYLACNLETHQVRKQTDIADVREYVEFEEEPMAALARVLGEVGISSGRVGIESRRIPLSHADVLRGTAPRCEFVSIDRELDLLQAIKDDWEIGMLEYGAQATLDAVVVAASEASAGKTEREFAAQMCAGMMLRGGFPEFLVLATADSSLEIHAEARDKPLEEGRIWRVDLGARFDGGIFSDLARTGVVGEPTEAQEDLLAATRAAQQAGFDAIEPGRPAKDIFQAVANEAKKHGLPFNMPHVGHGLGLGLHEFPLLEPANDAPLEPGMVLNIEPGVMFADREEVYHTEDLALVTESGYRLLTQPQDALLRLGPS